MITSIRKYFLLLAALPVSCLTINAQSTSYSQFWNEFAFNRPLNGKWSLELNVGQTWTSIPGHSSMFSNFSQMYVRVWAHYYMNAKFKFSYFYGYYYNEYLPEMEQKKLPELRSAFQAIWYLHKVGYTLNTRFRVEDRHLKTEEGKFEAYYRLRTQLKMVYPINAKLIRENVVYAIGSNEFFFKNKSQLAGKSFFDRNRLTVGLGYAVTDDLQLEVTYANEFLPRDDGNEIYNALQINVGFNNFLWHVREKLFHKKKPMEAIDK